MLRAIMLIEWLWSRLGSLWEPCYIGSPPLSRPSLDTLGEDTPCPTMNLSVRDAASLLKVSEKTIYRWIKSARRSRPIACRSSTDSTGRRLWSGRPRGELNVSSEIFAEPEAEGLANPVPASTALEAGGVLLPRFRLRQGERAARSGAIAPPAGRGRPANSCSASCWRARRLRRRPSVMGSRSRTCATRSCCTSAGRRSRFASWNRPIEYGALDGKPVHTLFTIISPTTRAHLHLMSKLAFVLRDAGRPPRDRAAGITAADCFGRSAVPKSSSLTSECRQVRRRSRPVRRTRIRVEWRSGSRQVSIEECFPVHGKIPMQLTVRDVSKFLKVSELHGDPLDQAARPSYPSGGRSIPFQPGRAAGVGDGQPDQGLRRGVRPTGARTTSPARAWSRRWKPAGSSIT